MPEDKETVKPPKGKVEKKQATITVDNVLKQLSEIDGVTTKEGKTGWIAVKDTQIRAHIKNTKYGVAVWSIKAKKTLPIRTKEDASGFVNSIKDHVKS